MWSLVHTGTADPSDKSELPRDNIPKSSPLLFCTYLYTVVATIVRVNIERSERSFSCARHKPYCGGPPTPLRHGWRGLAEKAAGNSEHTNCCVRSLSRCAQPP